MSSANKLNFIKRPGRDISILFIHGNSLSSEVYVNQFSSTLLQNFSLFAFDFPGHGDSPKSLNPELDYSVEGMAAITTQFVDEHVKGPVILVGYSSGGNVAIDASPKIENLAGLVILCTPPVGSLEDISKGYLPEVDMAEIFFNDNLDEDKLNRFCRLCTGEITEFDKDLKNMILRTDNNFRSTLAATVMQKKFADEVNILKELKVPVTLMLGELDSLINPEYLKSLKIPNLWKGEIQLIKDALHLAHLTHSYEFNKLLNEFITEECM